jgi:hypothetical protein
MLWTIDILITMRTCPPGLRGVDVFAGSDAVKMAASLPARLDAERGRIPPKAGFVFNATARTVDGFWFDLPSAIGAVA